MDVEFAPIDARMAPAGEGILRSLQNESLPVVDLVIRESFQNSLDASISNKRDTIIKVNTHKIETKKIASYFQKAEKNLIKMFPKNSTVLSIRDSNTSGLTGEFKTKDKSKLNNSNIYKLIYGLHMNQRQEDAGGSWGLGKTSYFRIGSGVVVYYSRVKLANNKYEERLAACLIEDSNKENAIIPENDRGITWWGEKDDKSDIYDKSYPITNEEYIEKFCQSFNLERYKGTETGTTIIIPFIDENKIVIKGNHEEGDFYWDKTIENQIRMAIQRWYFPRIDNKIYQSVTKKSKLIPILNNEVLLNNDMNLVFQRYQKIYNAALVGKSEDNITAIPIYLKSKGMEKPSIPVGFVAFSEIIISELDVNSDEGTISSIALVGSKNHMEMSGLGGNIFSYARKPGMIIEYVINDNQWMRNIRSEEGKYIYAIFVPNSNGKLHRAYSKYYNNLESYLRDTEQSDHTSWQDKIIDNNRITIITRIQNEVSKALGDILIDQEELIINNANALSRKFGEKFLPKFNYGKSATNRGTGTTPPKEIHTSKRAIFNVIDVNYVNEIQREIHFSLNLIENHDHELLLKVHSLEKTYTDNEWRKIFGNDFDFPFYFNSITFTKVKGNPFEYTADVGDDKPASLKINIGGPVTENIIIEGNLIISVLDNKLVPAIDIKATNLEESK